MGKGIATFIVIALHSAGPIAAAPILYQLPFSQPLGLSPDGATVVGSNAKWSPSGGTVTFPTSMITDASVAGTCVSGFNIVGGNQSQAVWWGPGGVVNLGDLNTGFDHFSRAHGISGDGSIVVGEANTDTVRQAFRWTQPQGMIALGTLPGHLRSAAFDITSDGTVIVGKSVGTGLLEEIGFRWTATTGMVAIPDLPGGYNMSTANAVSADGTTIVGISSSTASFGGTSGLKAEAYRWTAGTGTIGLGDLPGGDYYSIAQDVNGDGSIIVGYSFVDPASSNGGGAGVDAFIWDQLHGMRSLEQVLTSEYGMNLGGWNLLNADVISDDGLTIAGRGLDANGSQRGWMITFVPEPASLAPLAGVAALASARRRRRV